VKKAATCVASQLPSLLTSVVELVLGTSTTVYVLDNRALMGCGIHGQYLYADTRTGTVIVKFSAAREAAGLLDIGTVRVLRLIGDLQL